MKGDLFRKEAVEKITGPEDLNSYVKALNHRAWLILIAIAIAIAGLVIFAASAGFPIRDLFFSNIRG
jgi:hypothetical protein